MIQKMLNNKFLFIFFLEKVFLICLILLTLSFFKKDYCIYLLINSLSFIFFSLLGSKVLRISSLRASDILLPSKSSTFLKNSVCSYQFITPEIVFSLKIFKCSITVNFGQYDLLTIISFALFVFFYFI